MEESIDISFSAENNLVLNNSSQMCSQMLPTISETCPENEEQAASLYSQIQEEPLENGEEMQEQQEELVAQELEVQEDTILDEDELEDMHMSKLRECDAASLRQLLQIETEMAARAKAKEEVIITSINYQREQLKKEQRQLDEGIANLLELENNLNQQLQHEELREEQLLKEMSNTGSILQMLKENFDGLKEACDGMVDETEKLEQTHNLQFSNYVAQKAEVSELIAKENREIKQIQDDWEKKTKEYAARIQQVTESIEKQTNINLDWEKRIGEQKRMRDEVEKEFRDKQEIYDKLVDEEKRLLDENKCMDVGISDLMKQKKEMEETNEKYIKEKRAELNENLERIKQLEEQKVSFNKALKDKVQLSKQLEEVYEKEEKTRHNLLNRKRELETNNQILKQNNKAAEQKLKDSIMALDKGIDEINEDTRKVMIEKNAAINTLKEIQETHLSLTTEISKLEESCKHLQDENVSYSLKAADDKNQLTALQHQLAEKREKILNEQQVYESECKAKLASITNILHRYQLALQRTEMEASTKKRLMENELSNYKFTIDNSMKINKENNDKIIEKLRINTEKVAEESNNKLKELENIRLKIEKKKEECDNLQLTLDLIRVDDEEKNEKPAGILKSPGKKTPPKNVSWRIPSTSSLDSDSYVSCRSKNTNNENSDDLLDQFMSLSSDNEESPEKRYKQN